MSTKNLFWVGIFYKLEGSREQEYITFEENDFGLIECSY